MPPDALLDLVCGPASPLPETYQRYRLVAHLGSGGQAEVYRAVRLCGGVSSAPMTVKVFRIDPNRPLIDELRSWDKGDAALMDLNNRGVQGICRRADGFYGPPPHRPGEAPKAGNAVPYQVYDYLHGTNLRDYLGQAASVPDGGRLNAVAALRALAGILAQMHDPDQVGATPVLHMDVKPSNVMVLTDGGVRLIDFTGARYWRSGEITQIAYTPEAGGPEALRGEVGPPYDVHGFGAVAYYLVTGALPRGRDNRAVPKGQHPYLLAHRALRDHLLATLADRPGDRPATPDLPGWVDTLATLVRQAGPPAVAVDWTEPTQALAGTTRAIGRARPAVAGTETEAYQRIQKLERALVELRGAVGGTREGVAGAAGLAGLAGLAAAAAGAGGLAGLKAGAAGRLMPTSAYASHEGASAAAGRGPGTPAAALAHGQHGAGDGTAGNGAGGNPAMRGRAAVVPKVPRPASDTGYDQRPAGPPTRAWRLPTRDERQVLKRGRGWSSMAALFAFVSWGVWAGFNHNSDLAGQLVALGIVLTVAAGLFAVLRLLGWLVFERIRGGKRRTAVGAHLGTALFLVAVGFSYLRQTTPLVELYQWLTTGR